MNWKNAVMIKTFAAEVNVMLPKTSDTIVPEVFKNIYLTVCPPLSTLFSLLTKNYLQIIQKLN